MSQPVHRARADRTSSARVHTRVRRAALPPGDVPGTVPELSHRPKAPTGHPLTATCGLVKMVHISRALFPESVMAATGSQVLSLSWGRLRGGPPRCPPSSQPRLPHRPWASSLKYPLNYFTCIQANVRTFLVFLPFCAQVAFCALAFFTEEVISEMIPHHCVERGAPRFFMAAFCTVSETYPDFIIRPPVGYHISLQPLTPTLRELYWDILARAR